MFIKINEIRINTALISDYELDAWECLVIRFAHGGTQRFAAGDSVRIAAELDWATGMAIAASVVTPIVRKEAA